MFRQRHLLVMQLTLLPPTSLHTRTKHFVNVTHQSCSHCSHQSRSTSEPERSHRQSSSVGMNSVQTQIVLWRSTN